MNYFYKLWFNEAMFNYGWNMMLVPMLMMSQVRDVVKPVPRVRLILIQGGKPEMREGLMK
ncbi:hypothetical protein D3C86_1867510 [compost metagenome]